MKTYKPKFSHLVIVVVAIVCSVLFLGMPDTAIEDQVIAEISQFEINVQSQLELMVVQNNINVEPINSQVAVYANQISSFSPENYELAANILGNITQAVSLVTTRY